MDLFNTNLNDMELTEMRRKQEINKGFPVYLIVLKNPVSSQVIDTQIFFTLKGVKSFTDSIDEKLMDYDFLIKYVTDVSEVHFKSN